MKKIIMIIKQALCNIYKKEKKIYFLYFFKIIFNSLSPIYYTYFSKYIIDSLFPNLNIMLAFSYSFIMLFLQLFNSSILKVIEYKIQNKSSEILLNDQETFLKDLDKVFFEKTENSEFHDDYHIAKEYVLRNSNIHIVNMMSNVLSCVISLISIVLLLKEVSIFAILLCVILYFIKSFFDSRKSVKMREYYLENYNLIRKIQYSTWGFSNISYSKENRIFKTFPYISKQIDDASIKHSKFGFKYSMFNWKYSFIPTLFSSLILIITYSYMIYMYDINGITIGDYSMLIAAFLNFNALISSIINSIIAIRNENMYFEKYDLFLKYMDTLNEEKLNIEKINSIEFKNVSYKYPNTETYALKNINIKITDKKISLVGENGSGKTTLIKLLMKLYKPTEGKILINGIDIDTIDNETYYSLFSTVFQDFKIYSCLLCENVTFNDNEPITELLAKVNLEEKVEKLYNKHNSMITKQFDDNGIDLSGGERQKIAIIRALNKRGLITIFDEPTSSLSSTAENDIYMRLNDFIKDTCFFISHRLSSCRFTDKIFVLENGNLIEYGSHQELINKKGLYYTLFTLQANNYEVEGDSDE